MATCKPGEDLICHICQNPYSDPVSLPCGHSFCLDCIREYLNTQDQSQFYTCPQCGKRFTARPSLQRNPKLSQHVEHLQSAREKPQVLCTYCINPSTPAIKTCLRCEVSLCSAHLAAHNRRLEHNLRNATKSLESQKCPDHNLPLKYYCPQDSACVCADCGLLGGHKGHKVESLYKASKTKKEELKTNLHRLDSKRMETETTIQSLQKSLSVEREKAKNLEEQVIATFRHLKEQLQDLEKTVLAEVSMQENKVSEYYSNLILELKKKEKKQSQNISDIKKLLRFTSPITFLQQSGAVEGATCKEEEEKGEESKEVPLIKELDPDLILGNVYRSLTAILTYNVPKGGTYKGMKEEGTSGKSLYTETKLEVDSVLDSKSPESGDVPVCPVIIGSTYRLEMKSSGLFRCTKTRIKFQVKHPLTIEYEYGSWGDHMTPVHQDGYEVISPLFNIKTVVQPGEVLAVYLPHYLSAEDCKVYQPYIKCVHYREDKIILESPTQVDPSYIILENPSFCCLGAIIEKVWLYISSFFSFPGVVLIYGRKLKTKYLIHLYLVPDHQSACKQAIHNYKCSNGFHLFDKPAYVRNACTKKIYTVSGPQGSRISPKELHFLFTKPSTQYPFSTIRINNKETRIRLKIKESDSSNKIWECQLEDDDLESLSAPGDAVTPVSDSKTFVKKNYRGLCDRMPLLPPILLDLRHRGVINGEEEEELLNSTALSSVRNDTLLKMIIRKGAEEELCKVLKEKDPRLVEDLERTTVIGRPVLPPSIH